MIKIETQKMKLHQDTHKNLVTLTEFEEKIMFKKDLHDEEPKKILKNEIVEPVYSSDYSENSD